MPGLDGNANRETSGRGGSILDHLGAEIEQGAGAERAGKHAREVDYTGATERATHVSAP